MYSCRQASRLMSLKMDQELTFLQRMTLRVHLSMCDGCNVLTRQLDVLRKVARSSPDSPDEVVRGDRPD